MPIGTSGSSSNNNNNTNTNIPNPKDKAVGPQGHHHRRRRGGRHHRRNPKDDPRNDKKNDHAIDVDLPHTAADELVTTTKTDVKYDYLDDEHDEDNATTQTTTMERTIWLQNALQILGYPGDLSTMVDTENLFCPSATDITASTTTGACSFPSIVQFLEDRCIRRWDFDQRERFLRHKDSGAFEKGIAKYLQELQCPWKYKNNNNEDDDSVMEEQQKWRVLHWLISYSFQEIHQDWISTTSNTSTTLQQQSESTTSINTTWDSLLQNYKQRQPSEEAKEKVSNPSPNNLDDKDNDACTSDKPHPPPNQHDPDPELPVDAFPLGFTSGDSQVDQYLTFFRMKCIVALEEEQSQLWNQIYKEKFQE
jgi:hypothetical protein